MSIPLSSHAPDQSLTPQSMEILPLFVKCENGLTELYHLSETKWERRVSRIAEMPDQGMSDSQDVHMSDSAAQSSLPGTLSYSRGATDAPPALDQHSKIIMDALGNDGRVTTLAHLWLLTDMLANPKIFTNPNDSLGDAELVKRYLLCCGEFGCADSCSDWQSIEQIGQCLRH